MKQGCTLNTRHIMRRWYGPAWCAVYDGAEARYRTFSQTFSQTFSLILYVDPLALLGLPVVIGRVPLPSGVGWEDSRGNRVLQKFKCNVCLWHWAGFENSIGLS